MTDDDPYGLGPWDLCFGCRRRYRPVNPRQFCYDCQHGIPVTPRAGRWRLLITCSRTWDDWDTAAAELGSVLAAHPDAVLVSGSAPHGDADLEEIWARLLGTTRARAVAAGRIEQHPADWDAHPRAGGYRRNAAMVKLGAGQCLAFVMPCALARCRTAGPHGTHGTTDCAGLAHKARIPVRRIKPAIDNLDNQTVTV